MVPMYYYCCVYFSGDNYIPDAAMTSHVTGIELGLCSDNGAIYTVNTLGDGDVRPPQPWGGCNQLSNTNTVTLNVPVDKRVIKIEAWHHSTNRWHKVRLTLDDNAILEYASPIASASDTLHTYNVPVD